MQSFVNVLKSNQTENLKGILNVLPNNHLLSMMTYFDSLLMDQDKVGCNLGMWSEHLLTVYCSGTCVLKCTCLGSPNQNNYSLFVGDVSESQIDS